MPDAPRSILDTNVLVAAGFRPASASGRLVDAVRDGRLVALWTTATQAEAEAILGRIPPLRDTDLGALFPEAGRVDWVLDRDGTGNAQGLIDQTLLALALATGAPLVTADRALADAAKAAGATVHSPTEADRRFG